MMNLKQKREIRLMVCFVFRGNRNHSVKKKKRSQDVGRTEKKRDKPCHQSIRKNFDENNKSFFVSSKNNADKLTSVSLCVFERAVPNALDPFALNVFDDLSFVCLLPATLPPGFVSAIVAPFFAVLSSFFCALPASLLSVYTCK